MAQKLITVEETKDGFTVEIPPVKLKHTWSGRKTTYEIDSKEYDEFPDPEDRSEKELLQICYLVSRQKNEVYQGEINKLIDEILKM